MLSGKGAQKISGDSVDKPEEIEFDFDFDHIHPRMIYEVLSHLKRKGSVNSQDLVEMMEQFQDLNQKEAVTEATDAEYI